MAVWGSFDAPPTWTDRLARVLVRRDEAGLARDDGARHRHPIRPPTGWRCGGSTRGSSSASPASCSRSSAPSRCGGRRARGRSWRHGVCDHDGFALTYNVGDSHVFFLPGHFMTAFCAGAGCRVVSRRHRRKSAAHGHPGRSATRRRLRSILAAAVVVAALAYAGWRGWSTWPAVDRHDDRRGEELIARSPAGSDDRNALLVSEMNWQLENVLLYIERYVRSGSRLGRLGDVMPHWPFLVAGQPPARPRRGAECRAQRRCRWRRTGRRFPSCRGCGSCQTLPEVIGCSSARHAVRAVSVLTPPRENQLDLRRWPRRLSALTNGNGPPRAPVRATNCSPASVGETPQVYRASNRPFTERFRVCAMNRSPCGWTRGCRPIRFGAPGSDTSCAAASTS